EPPKAVTSTTGVPGRSRRSCRSTSSPLDPAITLSRTTTCGAQLAISGISPSAAACSCTRKPSRSRASRRRARISVSSSTIMTRGVWALGSVMSPHPCNRETRGTTRRERRSFTAGTPDFPGGHGHRGGGPERGGAGGGEGRTRGGRGDGLAGGGRGRLGLLEPPLQRPHRHAEDLRGGHLVAVDLLEHASHVLAFERGEGRPEGRAALVQREL